jgi:hypothetical protein
MPLSGPLTRTLSLNGRCHGLIRVHSLLGESEPEPGAPTCQGATPVTIPSRIAASLAHRDGQASAPVAAAPLRL